MVLIVLTIMEADFNWVLGKTWIKCENNNKSLILIFLILTERKSHRASLRSVLCHRHCFIVVKSISFQYLPSYAQNLRKIFSVLLKDIKEKWTDLHKIREQSTFDCVVSGKLWLRFLTRPDSDSSANIRMGCAWNKGIYLQISEHKPKQNI